MIPPFQSGGPFECDLCGQGGGGDLDPRHEPGCRNTPVGGPPPPGDRRLYLLWTPVNASELRLRVGEPVMNERSLAIGWVSEYGIVIERSESSAWRPEDRIVPVISEVEPS